MRRNHLQYRDHHRQHAHEEYELPGGHGVEIYQHRHQGSEKNRRGTFDGSSEDPIARK